MVTTVSAREAAERILGALSRQPPLRVPLDDCLGSVLAESVASPIDVPFWTNSAMDGYAVRATDVRGASPASPKRLTIVDRIPAGTRPTATIGPGQCARIFTGAPVPDGADSVIRQEDTDLGDPTVTITSDRDAGTNVRLRGEDIEAGAVVLERGRVLGPAELGVLASIAAAHPVVYRRPRVALLAGGDEIAELDQSEEILSGAKIASSNSHSLLAAIKCAGGEPVNLGIAADTVESLRSRLESAADADLIVTTAGISVGEHDHLRTVVASMGGTVDFWRIRMRPGAPVGFGAIGEIPWIGLPGNPVSALVTFELFVRPAIRAMMGHDRPHRRACRATAAEPIKLVPRLQHFLRGIVDDGALPTVRLTGPQGSGILTSLIHANCLVMVPEGQQETPLGAPVDVIRFDDPVHQAHPSY